MGRLKSPIQLRPRISLTHVQIQAELLAHEVATLRAAVDNGGAFLQTDVVVLNRLISDALLFINPSRR